jgi:hypothetical protein
MMNLLQGASDDQVALIGCLFALVSSAGLMYLSFFVGPASRKQAQAGTPDSALRQMPMRTVVDSTRERAA